MSQQMLQQRLDQDYKFAPSERPKRRRPIAATNKPVIAALALTASFCLISALHVASYAGLARLEYRRQAAVAQVRRLEADNTKLRFDVEQARAQERVVGIAQQWGMALADPASQVDYIILPRVVATIPGGRNPYLLLRDLNLTQQVSSVVTTGWGGAARGPGGGQQMARP
jgi:hypothetical protein